MKMYNISLVGSILVKYPGKLRINDFIVNTNIHFTKCPRVNYLIFFLDFCGKIKTVFIHMIGQDSFTMF